MYKFLITLISCNGKKKSVLFTFQGEKNVVFSLFFVFNNRWISRFHGFGLFFSPEILNCETTVDTKNVDYVILKIKQKLLRNGIYGW